MCPRGGVYACAKHPDITVALLPGEALPPCGECQPGTGKLSTERADHDPAPTAWTMLCEGDLGPRDVAGDEPALGRAEAQRSA